MYLFVRHAHALHQARAYEFGARTVAPPGDWPLTARGERQAHAAGRALREAGIERVVSSTLRRARETAERIAERAGVPYEHAWPELDEIPPRTLRRSESGRPEWLEGLVGAWHVRRHARGASCPLELKPVEARVRKVLARLDAMDEEHIAVVSHGYFILLMALLTPGRFRMRWIANCSATRIDRVPPGEHRLVYFARDINGLRAAHSTEEVSRSTARPLRRVALPRG